MENTAPKNPKFHQRNRRRLARRPLLRGPIWPPANVESPRCRALRGNNAMDHPYVYPRRCSVDVHGIRHLPGSSALAALALPGYAILDSGLVLVLLGRRMDHDSRPLAAEQSIKPLAATKSSAGLATPAGPME